MIRRIALLAAVSQLGFGAGCASGACPRSAACGVASWQYSDRRGISWDGVMTVVPALSASGGALGQAGESSDRLVVSNRSVYLRFDTRFLALRTRIERAVLSLTPNPSWVPRGNRVTVVARGTIDPFTSVGAAMDGVATAADSGGSVLLGGTVRTPVRIDVTAILRAWKSGELPTGGIALLALGDPVVFNGPGAEWFLRPKLEIVTR